MPEDSDLESANCIGRDPHRSAPTDLSKRGDFVNQCLQVTEVVVIGPCGNRTPGGKVYGIGDELDVSVAKDDVHSAGVVTAGRLPSGVVRRTGGPAVRT